jgi:hypothetical protein
MLQWRSNALTRANSLLTTRNQLVKDTLSKYIANHRYYWRRHTCGYSCRKWGLAYACVSQSAAETAVLQSVRVPPPARPHIR